MPPSPKKPTSATATGTGLDDYRKKRNPGATNEPFSPEHSISVGAGTTWAGRFVVHQHDATRMHWDLRLEIGGSLQSFAVPKGPSLDPAEKRLAMHTENHPLSYLDFEDVIPEGNYGAGAMIVWDTGGVVFLEMSGEEGLEKGKLDFVLRGFKLSGRFALIATGKNKKERELKRAGNARGISESEWLLVKKPDQSADPNAKVCETKPESVLSGLTVNELPRKKEIADALAQRAADLGAKVSEVPLSTVPMVCSTEGATLDRPDWLYELKLDGVRILAHKERDLVRLLYRTGNAATSSFPEVARSISALCPERVILDGEIVTFDERGRPNFARLLPRVLSKRPRDVEKAMREVPVVFLCFDILAIGDRDLRSLPLTERKALLKTLLTGEGRVRVLDHIEGHGDALFALCEREDLEGIVAKRSKSTYQVGPRRSPDWIKVKRSSDSEFVVLGWAKTKGLESLGSLAIGSYREDQLIYRGRVGSGLDSKSARETKALLESLTNSYPQFVESEEAPEAAMVRDMTWVKPELVVRVRFQGFTESGHLRAPVFQGVRTDIRPTDCRAAPHEEEVELITQRAADTSSAEEVRPSDLAIRVTLTNREKVYFPEDGITKGDLLDYSARIAPTLLPFLAGRPVVLVRYPDGILGKSFYQWRVPEGSPDWLRTFELYDEEKQLERGTGKAAFLIDSLDALLHVMNLGCIPLHVLACREHTPTQCDFLTIDFDIGERPFSDAVRLALSLREILEELGLSSFPKTSGQRGLHVLLPLGPGVPFQAAKLLCELLGRVVVGRNPKLSTMERRKDQRGDKVYVDTGQTGRSRTIVAPYSVRAYPGARVSTPLRWDEIHLALDPGLFTIETVPDRVQELGDPLAPFLEIRPNLEATLAKLGEWAEAFRGR